MTDFVLFQNILRKFPITSFRETRTRQNNILFINKLRILKIVTMIKTCLKTLYVARNRHTHKKRNVLENIILTQKQLNHISQL